MQENQKHIEQLFFNQIKKLSVQSAMNSYDYQFSDAFVGSVGGGL
ncbi:MAG: hypothetical protein ACOCQQ_01285 [Candidatus Nanoarchaeia archaeon]